MRHPGLGFPIARRSELRPTTPAALSKDNEKYLAEVSSNQVF
jgi:hypothetical protein